MSGGTQIQLQVLLEGGHSQRIELAADAAELTLFFQILASRGSGSDSPLEQFFQLPMDGGRESFSFHSSQLVAVSTRPPIVIEFEQPPSPVPASGEPLGTRHSQRPEHMVIDNFLGHGEHLDMLAHALQQKDKFDVGTVVTGSYNARQNLAILDFAQHSHSTLLCNRLLTWYPHILDTLGMDPFPVAQVESQMTASNDGHYYRAHLDADKSMQIERALTCVYYFSKQPAQFSGGALRIYDSLCSNGQRLQADTYQQIEPVSNRMVVFPSDSYHELLPVSCPSRKFEDSRFAVTNWIWRTDQADPQASHGWGHLHCAKLPEDWRPRGASS
ncbi:MAG: Rps23 Pro-64 3,4-dihydroxylase Tpa1-like proline 4-hydroxylase [Alcanivorax sp.]|jgi:Rps23 Pro-64 3,4-dihydroxylase Tpa1-like proline 4-hydroxylase